ncbi:restriction endonuclease subunit S [Acetobacter tropicalis]|uniref:restriction endonuclease subunit S n=2 Tax=Acetobacteraceae TaxID=433 RepID=UPI000A383509|nr:restriction endonuclease subunit S [Acetobacter tropicalis]
MSKSQHAECGTWPSDNLPSSWEWAEFEDFFYDRTNSIKKIQKKDYCEFGEYPIIDQGNELIGGYSNAREKVAQTSLPCIVWGDHTRCIKYLTQEFIQGADGVKVLEPSPAIDPRFSYLAMLCVTLPNKGYSRHFKFLKATIFPVPPLAEQRRIVAKLDSLTACIARARAELERVRKLTPVLRDKALVTAFNGNLLIFSKSEPAAWITKPFGEVGEIASNLVPPEEIENLPHIAPNHIRSGIPGAEGFKTISEDKVISAKNRFFAGQIIYSKIRPNLRKVALVDFEGGCSADMYPINARCNAKYLMYWLLSPQFTNMATKSDGRTVLPKINQKALNAIPTPVAPIELQKAIALTLDKVFERSKRFETESQRALTLLDRLESSLLAKAFRGELVPQNPNDEPASVLLDRIRTERAAAPKPKRKRKA